MAEQNGSCRGAGSARSDCRTGERPATPCGPFPCRVSAPEPERLRHIRPGRAVPPAGRAEHFPGKTSPRRKSPGPYAAHASSGIPHRGRRDARHPLPRRGKAGMGGRPLLPSPEQSVRAPRSTVRVFRTRRHRVENRNVVTHMPATLPAPNHMPAGPVAQHGRAATCTSRIPLPPGSSSRLSLVVSRFFRRRNTGWRG